MSQQDRNKLVHSALFRQKVAKGMTVNFSTGIYTTQEPGPSKSEVLLVDTLEAVWERMRTDKMPLGDNLLAAKVEAVSLATAEDGKVQDQSAVCKRGTAHDAHRSEVASGGAGEVHG